MKTFITYRYFLKPNNKQKQNICKIIKDCEFVEKLFIDDVVNKKSKKSYKDLMEKYKSENDFLKDSDTSALFNTLFKTSDKLSEDNTYYPRKSKASYTTSFLKYGYGVKFVDDATIYLPKVGYVPIVIHRKIPEGQKMIKCTIRKEKRDKFFANITVEFELQNTFYILDKSKSIGLDYSNSHFLIDNKGNEYNIPKFYRGKEKRLARIQREMKNCQKGSNNYFKYKKIISNTYELIKNQRNDCLHQLSTKLVKEYDVICVEHLDLQEMSQVNFLRKSTLDNAYSKFVDMLDYKCKLNNKKLVKIDRWFPSSKMCSSCGYINESLKLKERKWKCPNCGVEHERDINAAINIRNEGLRLLP